MQDRNSSPAIFSSDELPTAPGFTRRLAPTVPAPPAPDHPVFIVKRAPILIVPPDLEPPISR